MTFECPECGRPFDSLEGAGMHALNSKDEQHSGYTSKFHTKRKIYEHNEDSGSKQTSETDPSEQTESDSGEYDLPEWPEGERNGDPGDMQHVDSDGKCCDDPVLKGEAGDVVIGEDYEPETVARHAEPDATIYQVDGKQDPRQLEQGDRVCANCETLNP